MLTVALAERFRPQGIAVNACHPGDVRSALSEDLGFGGHQTPESGAETPLVLAIETAGAEHTGCYFANRRPERCRFGEDRAAVAALYERLSAYSSPTQRR
jgi:NAD(P)-dependent dehydrogenase (short-subunit alcohol dehydrogenase family)